MCAAVVVVSSLDQTFQNASSSSSSQLSFSPLVLSFYVSFRTRDDVIKTIDCRSHDLLHRAPYSNKKKEKERKKKTRLALSLPCGFFSSFFFFFFLSFFLSSLLSSHYYMFEVSFTWRPLQLFNARPRLYTQGDGPTGALTISQHEPSVT